MSARSKLLVKLAQQNTVEEFIGNNSPPNVDANPSCEDTDVHHEDVLMDIPLDGVFELPENITREIQDQIVLVNEAHLSEPVELDQTNSEVVQEDHNNLAEDGEETDQILRQENSSEENLSSQTNSDSDSEVTVRRQIQPRRVTQLRRSQGQNYRGYKRSSDGKIIHNIEKPQRGIKNRCSHKLCKKPSKRSFRCAEVTENSRKTLFEYFWKLPNWEAKKSYLRGVVTCRDILRRRKPNENSSPNKKQTGYDCYIATDTGEKVMVCRQMFLNTLDIGRDTLQRWCKTSKNDSDVDEGSTEVGKQMGNVKASSGKKAKETAINWLASLPKVPSHYCRASSKKMYIESVFRSKLHVYQEYRKHCMENNNRFISRTLFRKIFKEKNIAIHKPRKDQCDICCAWKVKTIPEAEYREHIAKKNEAEEAKKLAKESASDEKLVVTMDVQSVLLAPKLEASAIYYKQKLQIHNFTVYSLNNKKADLYVWHEANGNVSANEFTTCIVHFIRSTIERKPTYKHVVLISDGCGYQNRNKVLASTLLRLASELSIHIEQLILERGHTMMEVDAIHSSLEAYFKPPIYAPSDYVSRMRQARAHHPYDVHNLDYTFFLDYENIQGNRRSIRPGRIAKVTDIRALLYLPTGEMKYKLRHNEEWSDFGAERAINCTVASPQRLYAGPIKIKKDKFNHLQELKSVMETDYHAFYDNLPHHN